MKSGHSIKIVIPSVNSHYCPPYKMDAGALCLLRDSRIGCSKPWAPTCLIWGFDGVQAFSLFRWHLRYPGYSFCLSLLNAGILGMSHHTQLHSLLPFNVDSVWVVCKCHSAIEVSGLCRISSLFLSCGFWEPSSLQAW